MRFLAGIIGFLWASTILAQATGDVESIGFDHHFRPGCWTPMVIRLTPNSGSAFEGKIAVYQDDADHNHAIFTRPISLRGNVEGGGEKTQRFWMYFMPQADLAYANGDLTEINRRLLVYLETKDDKQIARLPVRDSIDALDHHDDSISNRLVLCVTGTSIPLMGGPFSRAIGVKELLTPVNIPIGNVSALLPENVLGYDSVDSVVWTDADPAQLSADQRTALEAFIKRGGKLVVTQTGKPNTWEMVSRSFAPLLPVEVTSIDQETDLAPLKRIVQGRIKDLVDSKYYPTWRDVGKPPYDYAIGKPKPGAVVDEYENADRTGRPFIVRQNFGMGTVTWVAQDLGDSNLTGRSFSGYGAGAEDYKWMYIWDRVMGWHDASQPGEIASQGEKERFANAHNSYHLTRSFLTGMEFPGRGLAYLSLAFLFFIVYWIFAGPGSYLYLASKKRKGNSWWAFAAIALIATGVTVLVVKLVLRGSAEVHHTTFVRQMPGEPTWIQSQFGLYVPKDNPHEMVELKKTEEGDGSYLVAYPSLAISDEGPPPEDYEIPVFDPKAVGFPFRSTLTKMQAVWIGDLPQGVEGHARLIAPETNKWIEGTLTNTTGRNLKHIYVAFRTRNESGDLDQLLYIPTWDNGKTIDLHAEFNSTTIAFLKTPNDGSAHANLNTDPGQINRSWESYWYSNLDSDKNYEDRPDHPGNFAMLSLYNRLAPVAGEFSGAVKEHIDLHRPALRDLDVSESLATGKLIVLAQTADLGPLPFPLAVEGDEVGGEGTTYYQFLLPLDRSILNKPPTTQESGLHPTTSSP